SHGLRLQRGRGRYHGPRSRTRSEHDCEDVRTHAGWTRDAREVPVEATTRPGHPSDHPDRFDQRPRKESDCCNGTGIALSASVKRFSVLLPFLVACGGRAVSTSDASVDSGVDSGVDPCALKCESPCGTNCCCVAWVRVPLECRAGRSCKELCAGAGC